MNNIVKNLLLALTLVCAIAFIVFCVQLIVLNRGVEPRAPGGVVSGGAQQGAENPDAGIDGDEPDGEDEQGTGEADETPDTPRPPPQGERFELMVAANTMLVVYAREELFEYEKGEIDWQFNYTGVGNASLEISFLFISPQGIAADSETFLNNYTGGTASEFGGEIPIKDSPLKGYYVSAMQGTVTYEAWIHTLPDSDLALVFVINSANDQQREALYEVLSSMEIIR